MDDLLLQIVKENLLVIGLVLAVLKVVAKATPWAVDDEILQILTNFVHRRKL